MKLPLHAVSHSCAGGGDEGGTVLCENEISQEFASSFEQTSTEHKLKFLSFCHDKIDLGIFRISKKHDLDTEGFLKFLFQSTSVLELLSNAIV